MSSFGISTTKTSGYTVVSRSREQWSKFGAIHQYMSAFLVCWAVSKTTTWNVKYSTLHQRIAIYWKGCESNSVSTSAPTQTHNDDGV